MNVKFVYASRTFSLVLYAYTCTCRKYMIFVSFSSQDPRNYTVTFGTRVNLPYMQHYVQQIFIHENYIRGELHDDIAVILSDLEISDNTLEIAKKMNKKETIKGFFEEFKMLSDS